ncbi:F420-dependent methylene-tetrahydromethanopterin reductase [Candidatus Entotheonella serta]|nr:F420-dependent methylene-tetrahydromethanopterin reductase [Candidatus Entotheonella serta]
MSLSIGITPPGLDPASLAFVREAERVGVTSVWAPETWVYDAFTPLGYLAAATETIRLATGIAQLGARTPAILAMSALALQKMSDGRFILGLGASGPQVIEGWHGVRFARPVTRTRETIEIIRTISAGERLTYDGTVYTLPLPDSEGRALRSPAGPVDVPIYIASLGPANLRLTGEIADGWIGTAFLPETADAFLDFIREGATAAGRTLDDIELTVAASLEFTDDLEESGRRHAEGYAFTLGAMGSAKTNFYNRAFARQGYADDVAEVQRLWLAGDREAARARVPTAIGLDTNLIGDDTRIVERLRLYRDAGINTIRVGLNAADHHDRLDQLVRLIGLVNTVNAEARHQTSPDR